MDWRPIRSTCARSTSVYDIKTRSRHKPLSLLIESTDQAEELAKPLPEEFYALARKFWPGPLTIIVKAGSRLPLKVTANTGNVALRVPNAKIPLAVVTAAAIPITATSANLSGASECTSAEQVREQLEGRINIIVDGGDSPRDVASTIVDLSDEASRWRIIREGAIPADEISSSSPKDEPPKDEDSVMTDESANQHPHPRWWLRLLVLAWWRRLLFLVVTAVQIVHTASLEEIHPADAIVVFGAAEYSGRPSPVLRARLDHALELFHRGVAPVVITTGGAAADPTFSEGGVGRDYLMQPRRSGAQPDRGNPGPRHRGIRRCAWV